MIYNIFYEMIKAIETPLLHIQEVINVIHIFLHTNNLISNSMKYANLKKDDPFIEVHVKASHEKAEVRVIDNGEGIPSEAQPKIFDMFYRGSARGMGSGLGLYIVKEALQKINGSISVVSEFGKGTEFVVEIPNMNHEGHSHLKNS